MIIKEGKIEQYGLTLNTLEVYLDNTTLLVIEGYGGFVMCGALDVDIYNTPKMIDRKVICAKAVGVRTIDELLHAPIHQACQYAEEIGWKSGMKIYDAFKKISSEK